MKLFECVPNISEGRDVVIVDACAAAIVAAGAVLAHRTSDPDHHRSVLTYFGDATTAVNAALALARITATRIDLRSHAGEHPRIGALDVLPFVPLGTATMDDAVAVARDAATRIWQETGVPSYFYGAAATREEHRQLPGVRSGGFEGLATRAQRGVRPDVGDIEFHPGAGAIAIGARPLLIAFNVVLGTGEVAVARKIARVIRESTGGLRSLRALGIALGSERSQVSCNITDADALPLDRLFDLVQRLAQRFGVAVIESELIGLLPRQAAARVVARRFGMREGSIAPPP